MGMAARKQPGEHGTVKDKLEQVLRGVLGPKLGPGSQLEELVSALASAMRGTMILGVRRPKQRKTTQRAIAMRLPEVGVTFPFLHKGQHYRISIVEGEMVELRDEAGEVRLFRTLKAVADAILGYDIPVGGWRFFFGGLSSEEVSSRYKAP